MVKITEITKANLKIHSAGSQKKITVEASNIIAGYTFTVPHLRVIDDWNFGPTTEVDLGASISGNVLTFATTTTVAGRIAVYGR